MKRTLLRIISTICLVMLIFTAFPFTYADESLWLDEKAPLDEYAYSLALIGDTQYLTSNAISQEKYEKAYYEMYDWIVENAESKKLKFVMGLGDITNGNGAGEWTLAKKAFAKMDGIVGYSNIRGNHDTGANSFNVAMPYKKHSQIIGGSYEENMLNVWYELVVGDVKYIIMCLDYGPTDEVLEWACGVVEDHPEHNVIITTHIYLYDDGTRYTAEDEDAAPKYGADSTGEEIWDQLVRKYENITAVICGHIMCDDVMVVQDTGDHGNVVTQICVDSSGMDMGGNPKAMVALLHFSEDGRNVQVEFYSTVLKQYYRECNQFNFEMDVVGDDITPSKLATFNVPLSEDEESSSTPEDSSTPESSATEESSVPEISASEPESSESESSVEESSSESSDNNDNEKNGNPTIYIVIAAVIVAVVVVAVVLSKKKK